MTALASLPIICLVQTVWHDNFTVIVQVGVSLSELEAGTGWYRLPGLEVESCSENQIKRFLSQQHPQYLDSRGNNVDKLIRRKAEQLLRTKLEEFDPIARWRGR
jgi:hypothetical protein